MTLLTLLSETASAILDSNLIKATAAASLAEYAIALEGVSSAVSASSSLTSTPASVNLEASLSMAMILLRDGPDGESEMNQRSTRIAATEGF